jgi:hypothetical protein
MRNYISRTNQKNYSVDAMEDFYKWYRAMFIQKKDQNEDAEACQIENNGTPKHTNIISKIEFSKLLLSCSCEEYQSEIGTLPYVFPSLRAFTRDRNSHLCIFQNLKHARGVRSHNVNKGTFIN